MNGKDNVWVSKTTTHPAGGLSRCEICGGQAEKWVVWGDVEVVLLCWKHRLQFDEAFVSSVESGDFHQALDYLSFLEGTLPSLNIITSSSEGFERARKMFLDAAKDARIKRAGVWKKVRQWIAIQHELFKNSKHDKHTIPTSE